METRSLAQVSNLIRSSIIAFLLLGYTGGLAHGQGTATVRVEENLRSEPQGVILGRLLVGTSLPVVVVQGSWVQVEVAGWIWTPSIQTTDRMGFDLVVSATPRENLREAPQGTVLGRLAETTLLERVEEIPGWTRVRRVAWVWGASLDLAGGVEGAPRPAQAPPAAPRLEERWWRAGGGGAALLAGRDGDTLALTRPGTEMELLGREGNWVRVRLEGWSWAPQSEEGDSLAPAGPLSGATPQDVAREPQAYRGRVVAWELQFVSLERAESVRTDFYEGEPFLLTRTSSPGGMFVYVAVSPERLGEVQGLIPLERIRVVGRIRTGAAALTGNPILDLLEITRLSLN